MKRVLSVLIIASAVALVFFGAFRLLKGSVDRVGASRSTEEAGEITSSEEVSHKPPELVPFKGAVEKNQNGEAVFTVDLQDFINSVNSSFLQKNSEPLLSPKEKWVRFADVTPRYGYSALCYRFSPDSENISQPTLSVFVPKNGQGIYELKLTFDEHGSRLDFYEKYKEMCLCVLSVLLPDMTDAQRDALYEKLYAQAMGNFRGGEEHFGQREHFDEELFLFGNFGFYGYYGGGTANICCVAG